MGFLSRAMKDRKRDMIDALENEAAVKVHRPNYKSVITLDSELALKLQQIADERSIDVERLVHSRMLALVNAYERGKILSLNDTMQYGQYKGLLVEEMIRADPRYTGWLASVSEIFVLDEPATELLRSLS